MKKTFILTTLLLSLFELKAQVPIVEMVEDINPSGHSMPMLMTEFKDKIFFVANNGSSGSEIWVTDGEDTNILKDINLGAESSSPDNFYIFNDQLYFTATLGFLGNELWVTDGTEGGTHLVRDINPSEGSSFAYEFFEFNNELYFRAENGTNGAELWKTDGTLDGTQMVKDIFPGEFGSNPSGFAEFNGKLYFSANDGTNGFELWSTDGTTEGTAMVANITESSMPTGMTVFGDKLYFSTNDGVHGVELWATDGTEAGTYMVKDLNPGDINSLPGNFIVVNDKLIFSAYVNGLGREFWVTDGTEAGTQLLKDVNPNGDGVIQQFRHFFYNDQLIMTLDDGVHGAEIWTTDGTEAGTQLFLDVFPGADSCFNPISPTAFYELNGKLYFRALDDYTELYQLWESDGTMEGTQKLMPNPDSPYNSALVNIPFFASLGETLYFRAIYDENGVELWKYYQGEAPEDNFPAPYCEIEQYEYVETISRVLMTDSAENVIIDNSSIVTNDEAEAPFHDNFTSIVGDVNAGETYSMAVEGTTAGTFTSSITVFVDWNQDEIFDNETERYEIGTITNSTGEDGQQAIGQINIPTDALNGETRMRIIKIYEPEGETGTIYYAEDGCIPGQPFGQAEDYTLNVTNDIPEGCLTAEYGQFPDEIFVPRCVGIPETVASTWTSQYSLVQVNEGTEYIFSVSNPTYVITIGNEDGTEVLVAGTGSITWTPDFSGIVRFYSHIDEDCNYNFDFHEKLIQCGERAPEPDYTCDQTYDNGIFDLANSVNGDLGHTVANDFFVPMESEEFLINSVTLLLVPIADNNFGTFEFKILSDNNKSPGEVVETISGLTPTNVESYPEIFGGYPSYSVSFDLGGYELPVNADADTRYWLQVTSTGAADNVYWIGYLHDASWNTAFNYESEDDGNTWNPITNDGNGDRYDSFWSLDATCSDLGLNDLNSFDFTYYPNPVKDVLNISSKKEIENVSVFNLAGQKVLNNAKVSNNQIDVSSLTSGTYVFKVTLEGGQIETFKIIKK